MILSKRLDASIKPTVVTMMRRLRTDSLLRNSAYVMATTALTAASGYLFWIIAARMYPAHVVGLASALIGTMMLAATLANLGIGPTLAQVLPRRESGEPWSLTLNTVLITGIATSLLAGSVAAIILPFLSPNLAVVSYQPGYALSLILGVPLLTLAVVLDATFTAERMAGNMLARAATFALLRIPLLLAPVLLRQTGALVAVWHGYWRLRPVSSQGSCFSPTWDARIAWSREGSWRRCARCSPWSPVINSLVLEPWRRSICCR